MAAHVTSQAEARELYLTHNDSLLEELWQSEWVKKAYKRKCRSVLNARSGLHT